MKIEAYERTFLITGALLLVGCLLALAYASFAMGIHLPGEAGTIDPETAAETPPFDQPGVRRTGEGAYEAVILASAWKFEPREIRVPAGSEVTLVSTTVDVIHGLHITGTRVNVMLIPGQIARTTYTFEETGEHLVLCHEYCGINHHTMFGKVIVE